MSKIVIYQVLPRYFGNTKRGSVPNGSLAQNGVGKFKDLSNKALSSIKELGVTHLWLTGVLEHATQTDYTEYGIAKDHPAVVKGKAGSPYAIKDYYDVDPDLAVSIPDRLKEFKALIHRVHQVGMKVIIDFIPNHLARQYHSDAAPKGIFDFGVNDRKNWAFSSQNNFYYLPEESFEGNFDMYAGEKEAYQEIPAKVTGNDCFSSHPSVNDWYETVKLNYGIDYQDNRSYHFNPTPDTWFKMQDVLTHWTKFGVDGFRCDMAEMVPVDFWAWVIPSIKRIKEDILFIGEVYNPGLYRPYLTAGFDYLYDKVGLYDTLKSVIQGYAPAFCISDCWQRLGEIQEQMLNFLENHDEQRIASDFYARNAQKAYPAMIVSTCLRNNPFMLYCGQEWGEKGMYQEGFSGRDGRSTIFDYWCIEGLADWNHQGKFDGAWWSDEQKNIRLFYQRLLNICLQEEAIYDGLFFDLMYVNGNNAHFDNARQYAFMRKSKDTLLLIVVNFNDQQQHVEVNIPAHAFEYLSLPPTMDFSTTDLLTGEHTTIPFSSEWPAAMQVNANSGRIWKYHIAY